MDDIDSASLDAMLKDPDCRSNLSDATSIGRLLSDCVVAQRFRLPDSFASSVELTPLGFEIQHEVVAANRAFRSQDIRFAIFLEATCGSGLLVSPRTDVDALRRAVTQEIKSRRIFFPYMYGRDFHDVAARLYPEKVDFDEDESLHLLKQLSMGVFQDGRITVGPAGCCISEQHRIISARRFLPGYYCSDETCYDIHALQVSTPLTQISKARELVQKHIFKYYNVSDDISARKLTRDLALDYNTFAIEPSEPMFDVLADSLTREELNSVAETLLRDRLPDRDLRKTLSTAYDVVINSPADFVAGLGRSAVLQLLMGFSDKSIVTAIDSAVDRGEIQLEPYEIRSAKVRRTPARDGNAHIGRFGIRVRRGDMAETLFVLLHHLYFQTGILEPADLEYSLEVEADRLEAGELLELAVRRFDPGELLRTLVFSQRRVDAAAAAFLGISFDAASKEERIQRALWKLGEPVGLDFGDLHQLRVHEAELSAAGRSNATQEVLRGHIANLFSALETALQRALIYSTWALTTDHFLEGGFEYDPSLSASVLRFIEDFAPTDNDFIRLRWDGGTNSLVPLAAGFARLQKALTCRPSVEFSRPSDQIPMICRATPLPFAYNYTLPYWNLSSGSRQRIMIDLEEISAASGHSTVSRVRNATVHGNNDFPSAAEIELALAKIGSAHQVLTSSGVFPHIFTKKFVETDKFGRSRRTYEGEAGMHAISAPTWSYSPLLPNEPDRMVIFEDAYMPSAGALRFYVKPRHNVDSYWEGWPKRLSPKGQSIQREGQREGSYGQQTAG